MARGWESKSIESQQDDARADRAPRRELTPEERQRAERRATLELALSRAQADLLVACRPAHREMLGMQLETIRAALAELE